MQTHFSIPAASCKADSSGPRGRHIGPAYRRSVRVARKRVPRSWAGDDARLLKSGGQRSTNDMHRNWLQGEGGHRFPSRDREGAVFAAPPPDGRGSESLKGIMDQNRRLIWVNTDQSYS